MDHECERCRSTRFYTRDGLTYCSNCNYESQAHGHETVVDDETIGTFQAGIASSLRKSTLKKNRTKNVRLPSDKYLASYTSVDAFSFILKGWTEDVIALGAEPSTMETVKTLWFKYLQSIGIPLHAEAGSEPSSEASIGIYPSSRDLVTKITGRKKPLSAVVLQHARKRLLRKLSRSRNLSSDEDDVDEQELRRRRRKRRRSFLKSLQSDNAVSSDTDASRLSSQSFRSDDFTLSLSSSCHSQDSSLALSSLDSSSDQSSLESDLETEQRKIESDAMALQNVEFRAKIAKKCMLSTLMFPRLNLMFSLLCLAIMMTKGNSITLCDLIYWADRESILFKSCLQHVPIVMQVRSPEDLNQFFARDIEDHPLRHHKIRQEIAGLGAMMKLNKAIFSSESLEIVFKRFLKEFSLPCSIYENLKISLQATDLMMDLHRDFLESRKWQNVNHPSFFALDIYVAALILFSLKLIYGLDDFTEYYRSADARKYNLENSTSRHFVICDWIELSRKRLFLAVKHCDSLHNRFSVLFPQLERSPEVLAESFEKISLLTRDLKQNVVKDKASNECPPTSSGRFKKNDFIRLEAVSKFFAENFEQSISPPSKIDVSKSLTPLHDMTTLLIDNSTKCDVDEIDSLHKLLEMENDELIAECRHPDAEEVIVKGDFVIDSVSVTDLEKFKGRLSYSSAKKPFIHHEAYYKTDHLYWRSSLRFALKNLHMLQGASASQSITAALPENFSSILKFFAAYCGCNPVDIYSELVNIENSVYKCDPAFFGIGLNAPGCDPRPVTIWNKFWFKLSL